MKTEYASIIGAVPRPQPPRQRVVALPGVLFVDRCYSPEERQYYCEVRHSETGAVLHTTEGFSNMVDANRAGLAARARLEREAKR